MCNSDAEGGRPGRLQAGEVVPAFHSICAPPPNTSSPTRSIPFNLRPAAQHLLSYTFDALRISVHAGHTPVCPLEAGCTAAAGSKRRRYCMGESPVSPF